MELVRFDILLPFVCVCVCVEITAQVGEEYSTRKIHH